MKNFTNNFKQFTSRLSARWLIMALMLLLGTGSAWAGVKFTNDYIFLDLSSSTSEWEKDGAIFQVSLNEWDHCGNGWSESKLSKKYDLIETSEGSHIYYANVSDDNKSRYGAYFYRCNPSDKSVWNTACIGYNNSTHNCFKVNGWTSSTSTYNLTDIYCISAPTFGEVEVGQSATSSGTYLYAGVSTIPKISNNSTEFQYVAGSSSITTNGLSTITVKFTPSSAGDKTGTLKFESYLTTSLSGKGKVSCDPPAAPTFDKIDAQCGSYTLPTEDKNKVSVNWYTAATGGNKITSVTQSGTYYAEAVVDGTCVSENRTDVEITIKTKPTISISGSEEAVLYEDVTLTATATDGATVKWYEGGVEKATGITYVVTSSSDASKTVTAKAFLNGCESTEASHPVTFSAEDCTPTADNTKIEIWCKVTGTTTPYCHAYNIKNSGNEGFKNWPGLTHTSKSGDYYIWTLDNTNGLDISNNKVGIVFSKNNSENNQTADITTFYVGNRYYFTYYANSNDKNTNCTKGNSEPLTTPAQISAPAAKTISVSTTDGEGNIIFSGQVVKTGCDATNEYGFQYSSDKQTWTTVKVGENAAAGTVISNNTVTGLDGTYYVCAYISNDNSTQYGAVKEITVSTEKDPITTVTLTHVKNQAGESYSDQELENLTYCVGDIVWFKLEQDGSNFQEYKWISYPGTELKGMYTGGMFQFKITKSGNVGIRLRNDANVDGEGNPTWVESNLLEFNTHPEPTAPYISINPASGIICQGTPATIMVENPRTDCSYKLVEGDTKADFTQYESGDLKYTVQNVGKYYVVAQHNACTDNEYTSNQVAINQIISTSATISIELNNPEPTPWEPVTITVKPDAGYIYELTYTDGNLAAVDGVRIKQNGDSYTYYIPRPDAWTTGDSNPVRTPINYGIKAQLKVDGESSQCDLNAATATIQLKDEDNEDCLNKQEP